MIKEEVSINPKFFFAFETNKKLFEKKHKDIFIWDIIRFDVYYELLWKLKSKVSIKHKNSSKLLILKEIMFFIYSLLFRKYDVIFFTASRNKHFNGKFFDQNLEDILVKYPKAICFESFERNLEKLKNKKISIHNPINVFRILFKNFYRENNFTEIIDLINKEFNSNSLTNEDLNNLIIQYQIDYKFYSLIFRFKKPKVIFITQNGIQKGLFAAAKKFKIPVIEVQHGIIDEGHLSYNYCKNIDYSGNKISLPSYFFTFSEFWAKDLYYPVNEIINIGNSYYSSQNEIDLKKSEKGLLVASSDIFGENLKELVIDFSLKYKLPIYFKLHPNQYFQKEYFQDEFKEFDNVAVFTNNKTVYELLELSCAVLVIQSTVIYEALHMKKIGIILKKQTYTRHNHLTGNPNVFLIDNSNDLFDALNNNYREDDSGKYLFFEEFKNENFLNFMKKIECQN